MKWKIHRLKGMNKSKKWNHNIKKLKNNSLASWMDFFPPKHVTMHYRFALSMKDICNPGKKLGQKKKAA